LRRKKDGLYRRIVAGFPKGFPFQVYQAEFDRGIGGGSQLPPVQERYK
jgi:hypothetical protein